MTTVGSLLGGEENETRKQMRDVLEFEMKLAKVRWPTSALRIPNDTPNSKSSL